MKMEKQWHLMKTDIDKGNKSNIRKYYWELRFAFLFFEKYIKDFHYFGLTLVLMDTMLLTKDSSRIISHGLWQTV